jgi:dihydrofolate synthase / folylpolyglutamate synthase
MKIAPNPAKFDPHYLVTLDEIYHSHWAARKRMRMQFLRDAVDHFWPKGHANRLIHITGTNGKGSVAHYLEQGLLVAGNTGSWTGPHVFDYSERFHINGQKALPKDIVTIYKEKLLPYQELFTQKTPGESLSFAELGILLTLHLFEKYKVKWGIMEVGAGGRYTPLMALPMEACILTNVGYDHPKTLGTEIWQRAMEKAGIARKDIPFFTSADEPALSFVRKTAEAEQAQIFVIRQEHINDIAKVIGKQPEFKLKNLALAVNVIRHFYPQFQFKEHAHSMLSALPARFWNVAPNIIADVSHNPDKVQKLVEQLKHKYPGKRFRFLIGLTRSRDVREVFAPILEVAEHIVVTSASYAGQEPQELAMELQKDFEPVVVIVDPQEALEIERKRLQKDQILVLTGSAYMIDQAINPDPYVKHLNATFGRRSTTV